MRFLSIIAAALVYACTTSTAGSTTAESVSNAGRDTKVLVEHFTSQGCSSCPSADKLVSRLAQADTSLIVISFHVDYWDRLGWKDTFSSPAYTQRQQQYARALHAEGPYTPQAVVQGQYQMVGSNEAGLTNAVKAAATQKAVQLQATASVTNGSITVQYAVGEAVPATYRLIAVLVQNQSSTSVSRGENSGRRLDGYHVAREMKTVPVSQPEDTIRLTLPAGVQPGNASVVLFIQDASSKKITAVKQVAL